MNFHPLADIFPLMNEAEFAQLKQSLLQNGQIEAIVTENGEILDGRNREIACRELKIEPRYKEFSEINLERQTQNLPPITPLEYVKAENLDRRNLNEAQRAMVADKLVNTQRGYNPQICGLVTQTTAAEMFKVSERSIQSAHFIRENAVERVIEQVEQGNISIHRAEQLAKLPKTKQINIIKKSLKSFKQLSVKVLAKELKDANKNQDGEQLAKITISAGKITEAEFKKFLLLIGAREPNLNRYTEAIIEEMEHLKLVNPVDAAQSAIFRAVDSGVQIPSDIRHKTKIDKDTFDLALGNMLRYGDLELISQGGKSFTARGARKYILKRPAAPDALLKSLCADCDNPVGIGYQKVDDDTVICKRCQKFEEKVMQKLTIPTRDFQQVLGKYDYVDASSKTLTDYADFAEVIRNEDDFTDPLGHPLKNFVVYRSLKEEFITSQNP